MLSLVTTLFPLLCWHALLKLWPRAFTCTCTFVNLTKQVPWCQGVWHLMVELLLTDICYSTNSNQNVVGRNMVNFSETVWFRCLMMWSEKCPLVGMWLFINPLEHFTGDVFWRYLLWLAVEHRWHTLMLLNAFSLLNKH